jgi:D-serine deaminase-like pyridoxal phosphate-dependent protein
MIDHPSQISLLREENPEEKWSIFVKIDCGSHRAGIDPQSQRLNELIQTALEAENVNIYGFYCHSGHSYASGSLAEAQDHLINEISAATLAAKQCLSRQPDLKLTVSVGATPTAHAASASVAQQLNDLPGQLELHAGNYSLLDVQQFDTSLVSIDQISSWIEVEVCSVYPERREILVNVGCLGLGREPGREPGVWGRAKILPDDQKNATKEEAEEEEYPWNVVRLSQEHGILAPRTSIPSEKDRLVSQVKVGSRVRIIPQHACVTGAMYESYIVVDEDDGVCVDEWVRCRGW